MAPYSFVCVHLMDNPNQEWVPVDVGEDDLREVDHDWVCRDCWDSNIFEDDERAIEVMRVICIHCVRALKPETTS